MHWLKTFKTFDDTIDTIQPEIYVFWVSLGVYLVTLGGVSTKSLMVYSVALVVAYFYRLKDIRLSLFLTYIATFFYDEGKSYTLKILDNSQLLSNFFHKDIFAYLAVRPIDLLAVLLLGLLLTDLIRERLKLKEKLLTAILLLTSAWGIYGSVHFSILPTVSVFMLVQRLGEILIFVYFTVYYYDRKRFIDLLLMILAVMVIFQGLLVVGQFLVKSQLGLAVEMESSAVFGLGADEDVSVYRPLGMFGHANDAASFFLAYFSVLVAGLYRMKKINYILLVAVFMSGVSMILTNSRSVWIIIAVMLMVFYHIKKRLRIRMGFLSKRLRFWGMGMAVAILVAVAVIFPSRIWHSFNAFDKNAGVTFRKELNDESWNLVMKNPVWGTGYDTNMLAMLAQNPTGIVAYVPVEVHNGLLKIASEQGIPAIGLMLGFIWLLIRRMVMRYKIVANQDYLLILTGGLSILALVSNNLVHTGDASFGLPLFILSFFVIYEYD